VDLGSFWFAFHPYPSTQTPMSGWNILSMWMIMPTVIWTCHCKYCQGYHREGEEMCRVAVYKDRRAKGGNWRQEDVPRERRVYAEDEGGNSNKNPILIFKLILCLKYTIARWIVKSLCVKVVKYDMVLLMCPISARAWYPNSGSPVPPCFILHYAYESLSRW
jgi:hypothetical protein